MHIKRTDSSQKYMPYQSLRFCKLWLEMFTKRNLRASSCWELYQWDARWVDKKKRHYRLKKEKQNKNRKKKNTTHLTLGICLLAQLDSSSNEKPKTVSNFPGHWNFRVRSAAEVNLPQPGHWKEELPPCTPASLFHLITSLLSKHFAILNCSANFAAEMSGRLHSSKHLRVILTVHTQCQRAAQEEGWQRAQCCNSSSRALAGGINFGLLGKTENGQKCIWGQSQCFPQPENKYFTPSFIFHVSVFLPSFCFMDLDKVDKFGLQTFL